MSYVTAITGTMPSRTDTPEDFSDNADALVASLPDFQSQINTVIDEINDSVDAVEADRVAVVGLKADVETLKSDCQTIQGNCETAQGLAEDARDLSESYRDGALVAAAAAGSAAGLPSLVGKATYVLTVNDDEETVDFLQLFKLDSIVKLTSGTSWECPAGVKLARLRLVGGAGGGGTGSSPVVRSGGGGPAELEALVDLIPGTTYTYAIGAGGNPGGSANTDGSSGGTTSITIGGVTYSASGGSGGTSADGGGAPGTTGANGIVKKGTRGFAGVLFYSTGLPAPGGVSASLGITGGYGSPTAGTAGDNGKIILELYK